MTREKLSPSVGGAANLYDKQVWTEDRLVSSSGFQRLGGAGCSTTGHRASSPFSSLAWRERRFPCVFELNADLVVHVKPAMNMSTGGRISIFPLLMLNTWQSESLSWTGEAQHERRSNDHHRWVSRRQAEYTCAD